MLLPRAYHPLATNLSRPPKKPRIVKDHLKELRPEVQKLTEEGVDRIIAENKEKLKES